MIISDERFNVCNKDPTIFDWPKCVVTTGNLIVNLKYEKMETVCVRFFFRRTYKWMRNRVMIVHSLGFNAMFSPV